MITILITAFAIYIFLGIVLKIWIELTDSEHLEMKKKEEDDIMFFNEKIKLYNNKEK